MNFKNKSINLVLTASLILLAGASTAQEGKGGSALLSSAGQSVSRESAQTSQPRGTAVCLSFEGQESWDGLDDADNTIIDLDIGAGNSLTGVGWDIGIATIGASWLSEATIQFSDSTGSSDPNAVNLNVGSGEGTTGDMDFSSGGAIIDFSDNALPDVVAGPDGILRLQLFESFDDNADAIDANYRNAAAPALCPGLRLACDNQAACDQAVGGPAPGPVATSVPVNNPWALGLLALLLAGLGFVAVRRFA